MSKKSDMSTHDYLIPCGNETISCAIDYADGKISPSVINLHGAGPSDKSSALYLLNEIQNTGKTILRFDYPGQGQSSGDMKYSSLRKRYTQTKAILEHFDLKDNLTVIGTSMGGYIASHLTKEYDVANLILFCPAAYTVKAWDVAFGSGFAEIIRSPGSFLETDIGNILADFSGNALFFIGSRDEIIPQPVVDMYKAGLSNCRRFEAINIDDCPHPIHRWVTKRDTVRNNIINKVLDFL